MMLVSLLEQLKPKNATLVAVSKTHSEAAILKLYEAGHRDFGENKVQELQEKYDNLPKDIRWHFIGHLQTNKVKYIAPFINLVHSIDSEKILKEINKRAANEKRTINCLLQFKIAKEDTKYGLTLEEAQKILDNKDADFAAVNIVGVMGMATYTNDEQQVRQEFQTLTDIFQQLKTDYFADNSHFKEISMGMSGDYQLALEEGSTMVRIGSLLFGDRTY